MCYGAPPCECDSTRLQRAMLGEYLAGRARWNWQEPRVYAISCFNGFHPATIRMSIPLFYLPVVNRAGIIQNLLKDAAKSVHVALVGYHMRPTEFGGMRKELYSYITWIVN